MSKIITKHLGTRTKKNETYNTAQMYKENNKRFTYKEVEQTLNALKKSAEKKGERVEFLITGWNGDRNRNLTSYNGDMITEQAFDDYYGGYDNQELIEFYQLQITAKRYT
jgi:hypothetical protein